MTYYSSADLARSFRLVRKNTLLVAEDIPESSYGFRAAPGTRSVAEMLAHVAAQPRWQREMHGVDRRMSLSYEDYGAYMKDVRAYEDQLTDRNNILDALAREGEAFAAWLEGLSDETLAQSVAFAPGSSPASKTRFEMLLGAKEHEMHHRAQLMVIQRLLGIVPHLTRARMS